MYIPAWVRTLASLGAIVLLISLFAVQLEIPLLKYWAIPLSAALPWLSTVIMVIFWSVLEKDQSRAQAMAMSGMFPLLGLLATTIISVIISFLVPPRVALPTRILWSAGISGLPAVALAIFLGFVFLQK